MERGSVRWHRGAWEVSVRVGGKRLVKRVRAPETRAGRRDAERVLDDLIAASDTGVYDLTVRDLFTRYEAWASADWSPSTRAAHPHHAAATLKAIGDVEVASLRRDKIQALYAKWLADGTSPATVRRRHNVLAAAVNYALVHELILRSPLLGVRLPTVAAPPKDLPPMVDVAAAISRISHRRLQALARLALVTGARRGELVGLRWGDLDLGDEGGTIRFTGSVALGEGRTLIRKTTKTGKPKTVTVGPSAVADLRRWRAELAEEALGLGVPISSRTPVFPSPGDPATWWAPDQVTQAWSRHRDGVGLEGVNLHDLRHRHVTTLLERGVPVHEVSRRVGHSSASMTLNRYAHAMPGDDAASAAVVEAATAEPG